MFNNRFSLVLGVFSLLVVTIAITYSRSTAPLVPDQGANDFYQRHPDWASNHQDAVVPVTGISEPSDYYQRHPELRMSMDVVSDTSDYSLRHPGLRAPAQSMDLTDYFLRHPELNAP